MTKSTLDKRMDARWEKLQKRCLPYGIQWMTERDKLFEWYEREKKKTAQDTLSGTRRFSSMQGV